MAKARFEWDPTKDRENQLKHGVGFAVAQFAFADPQRVIAEGTSHSSGEQRYLLWRGWRWRNHRQVHLPTRRHSHHWRRLLAKG